jgi:hypothetical protein
VADVLAVAALEMGDPVLLFVLVESDDPALHAKNCTRDDMSGGQVVVRPLAGPDRALPCLL